NYPRSTLETVAEADDPALFSHEGTRCWTADIDLQPELYPILRHAQFEDLLNRSYADPIDSLLRALLPMEDGQCLVEFRTPPVTERRRRAAERAIRLLDRRFFRTHIRLAHFYATHAASRRWRLATLTFAAIARCSAATNHEGTLETSTARTHEREANL